MIFNLIHVYSNIRYLQIAVHENCKYTTKHAMHVKHSTDAFDAVICCYWQSLLEVDCGHSI